MMSLMARVHQQNLLGKFGKQVYYQTFEDYKLTPKTPIGYAKSTREAAVRLNAHVGKKKAKKAYSATDFEYGETPDGVGFFLRETK